MKNKADFIKEIMLQLVRSIQIIFSALLFVSFLWENANMWLRNNIIMDLSIKENRLPFNM